MRLGILGSGQLAKMLAFASRAQGHDVVVYTQEHNGPAHALAHHVFAGRLDDHKSLRQFFSHVDAVMFENEFIDRDAIHEASKDLAISFFPSTNTVFRLSNKIEQKAILKALDIPTARATPLPSPLSKDDLHKVLAAWHFRCVLKWSRFGYDGKGVFIVHDHTTTIDDAYAFCNDGLARGAAIIVEELVSFSRELAMVAVRSKSGHFTHYPLVISRQERGVCKDIIGPATALLGCVDVEKRLAHYLRTFAEHMNMVGVFAFEFFHADNGDILVNEIAPRVHNSAHFTLDACTLSQFDNHIRAITDAPLDTTTTAPFFAMRNLLGPLSCAQLVTPPKKPYPAINLHWYDKKETRPFRKLGHLNVCAANLDELHTLTDAMMDYEAQWLTEILTQKDAA